MKYKKLSLVLKFNVHFLNPENTLHACLKEFIAKTITSSTHAMMVWSMAKNMENGNDLITYILKMILSEITHFKPYVLNTQNH